MVHPAPYFTCTNRSEELDKQPRDVQDYSQEGVSPCENNVVIGHSIEKEGLLTAKSNGLGKSEEVLTEPQ